MDLITWNTTFLLDFGVLFSGGKRQAVSFREFVTGPGPCGLNPPPGLIPPNRARLPPRDKPCCSPRRGQRLWRESPRSDSLPVEWNEFWKSVEFVVSGAGRGFLGGGNSNIFYFHPDPWGNDPIWRAYFSNGLVQPPPRNLLAEMKTPEELDNNCLCCMGVLS